MSTLPQNLRVAKATGRELTVLPLRATDGSLVANVTAYAAVGAGCEDSALAYELLRKMLLEDSQWRERVDGDMLHVEQESYGWPLLTEGYGILSDQVLWNVKGSFDDVTYFVDGYKERWAALDAATLTEEDFSVLNEIDKAVFPSASIGNFADKITNRLEPALNPDAADVDVHAFAQELLHDLQMRLAEG